VQYLEGAVSSAMVFYNLISPLGLWSFFVSWDREDIGSFGTPTDILPLAFDGIGPGFKFVWFPSEAWEILSTTQYSKRRYTPLALPGSMDRQDDQTSLSARVSYRLDKDLSFYLLGDFTSNKSTLDDSSGKNRNYNQWSVFGGTTWELSL
jgi:hypothetical protein